MNNFGFKIENTVKVEILADIKANDCEIEQFFMEADLDFNGIIGFYGSSNENAFYVKFTDDTNMAESVTKLDSMSTITIKGKKCGLKVVLMEFFETTVSVRNLPFEVSNEILCRSFEKYGKINNISWEKIKSKAGNEIFNGVRKIQIHLTKVPPPYIYVMGIKVNVTFRFQRDMCYSCMSIEHHRDACSSRTESALSISDNKVDNVQTEDDQIYDNSVSVDDTGVKKRRKQKRKKKEKCDASQQTEFDKIYEDKILNIEKELESGVFNTLDIVDRFKQEDIPIDTYFYDKMFLTVVIAGITHEYPLNRRW